MKILKSEYDVVLFDLDGTLSQSALGIRHSLEYALSQMGKTDIDLSDYSIYIGPPLLHTLKVHLQTSLNKTFSASLVNLA